MKILVHDYAGHAFSAQLSRRLASRGHAIEHVFSQSVLSPQGSLSIHNDDPPTLAFSGIQLKSMIRKQAFFRRYVQEATYARLLRLKILKSQPDLVISGNGPLDAQSAALSGARSVGARFVFWLQDVQGIAIERLLKSRLGIAGTLVGRYYKAMECRLLRASDAIVSISEDFNKILGEWNVRSDLIHTIPNWTSPEEMPLRSRNNEWARSHGLVGSFCFLYSGTLGMKHHPALLLELANRYKSDETVCVVVVSEGDGARWLAQQGADMALHGLKVLPFQKYADLPNVLASADVLLTILQPNAGVFSVPSKVLSYLCAGRPLLLAIPLENLSARIAVNSGAGVAVRPDDVHGFLREADLLRSDVVRRASMSRQGREYAERNFDLDRITDRFEEVFRAARARRT